MKVVALVLAISAAWLGACASSATPTPKTVIQAVQGRALSALWGGRAPSRDEVMTLFPMRVDFRRGDRVPMTLFLSGQVFRTPENVAPVELEVLRDFSMIMRLHQPPLFSFDGKRWDGLDAWKGSVRVGLGASAERGTHMSMGVELDARR